MGLLNRFKRLTLSGNIFIMTIESFLSSISLWMRYVVWQPFVLSLGASVTTLGFLQSLKGRQGLLSSIVQPVAGRASDRVGRRPFIALGSLLTIMALSLYLIADAWPILILGVVIMALSWASKPAWSSMIAESVNREKRGAAYSLIMFSSTATGLFAPLIGGLTAKAYGFQPIFLICIALEAACFTLTIGFLKETLSRRGGGVLLAWSDVKSSLKDLLGPTGFLKGFYASMMVDSFAWSATFSIFYGMLTKTYGFTLDQLGAMASLFTASIAASQIPIGRLIDKYGRKLFLAASEAIGLLVTAGFLCSRSFEAFTLLQIPMGIVVSTWAPAMQAYVADNVPERSRAEAMGRLSALRGLIAFPAPFIGGLLYDSIGFWGPIVISMLGIAAALTLILLFAHESP